jgi:nitrate reductase gamma subunit
VGEGLRPFSRTSAEFSIVSGGIACIIGVALLAWRRQTFWNEAI